MNILLKKLVLLILVFFTTGVTFSQTRKKIKKADEKYERFSYIDARKIYEDILKNKPEKATAELYQKLGDTYYFNSEYPKAAELFTTLREKYRNEMDTIYYFKLAQSLKSQGKFDEARKVMDGIDIKKFSPDLVIKPAEQIEYEVDEVEINEPGASDFGTSYYQDKLVYASAKKSGLDKTDDWTGEPYLDLYMADVDENGKLSNSSKMTGEINTQYHESSAAFTKDGTTVYFTRNNFIGGKASTDKKKTIRLKLYKATRSGSNFWTNVRELPMSDTLETSINSNDWSAAHPALSLDEKRLYFASDRPGSKEVKPKTDKKDRIRLSDIWYVDILPGVDKYSNPKPVEKINTIARETFPFISEKNELYYSSDGVGSKGGLDVFKTQLENGIPGDSIVHFPDPINREQDDFGFIWSDSKKIGYFTSNRKSAQGGSVADDIYRVVEKECIITLKGLVTDVEFDAPIPGAKVELLDSNNNNIGEIIVGEDGAYSFDVECCKEYTVRGSKEKDINKLECYDPNEVNGIETPCDKTSVVDVPVRLKKDPCCGDDLGACLCLQPIYFDFDRHEIRPDAAIELIKVATAMKLNPSLKVSIESHTDSRGSHAYNVGLSDKRAQSTLNWLVDNGIERSRLTAEGFGENQLLDRCTYLDECGNEYQITGCSMSDFTEKTGKCRDGDDHRDRVTCTEEEHQQNRRSKFIIVEF